jgi:uncharacterized protein YndB with AHSA1/START domain
MTAPADSVTSQVYQTFIKATPQEVWEAITTPEFTSRFFHGAKISADSDRIVSVGTDGAIWMDEEVEVFDPPKLFVHGWRSLYDPDCAGEATSRVTWQIEEAGEGVCRVVVTHDRLEGAPKTAASVFGAGWMFVLSGLKTLLETGEPLLAVGT